MHVYLEEVSPIERRVEEHEKALVEDVRAAVGWVFFVLDDLLLVFVAVEELVGAADFD